MRRISPLATRHSPLTTIHYKDIGDYLDRSEKLKILAEADGIQGIDWQIIVPNAKHDWINQRGGEFDTYIPLRPDKKTSASESIFLTNVVGVATGRDAWVLNFSKEKLAQNMQRMIAFYNEQSAAYKERKEWDKKISVEQFLAIKPEKDSKVSDPCDPKRISWTRALRSDVKKSVTHSHNNNAYYECMYRPFTKQLLYYDKPFIESPGIWSQVFPEPGMENLVICVMNVGSQKEFSTIITDQISEYQLIFANQCFPLYTYVKSDGMLQEQNDGGERYVRRENISDAMLAKFRKIEARGEGREERGEGREASKNSPLASNPLSLSSTPLVSNPSSLTKEDIFYYVYGILHSPSYRERFAADLKKQLPRIPMVEDFWTFSEAGRKLAALHVNYERGEMYPLVEVRGEGREARGVEERGEGCGARGEFLLTPRPSPLSSLPLPLTQMKFPSKTDKSKIIYNSQLTLSGIPAEAYRYVVNGKSAIEWVMERYAVKTDKDSGIVNDPNDWCREQGNERYIVDLIKRVVHLSVESVKIIDGLPVVEI